MLKPLALLLCIAAAVSAQPSSGWKDLFDGKSLNGWTPAESKTTWKVVNGLLTSGGPRSHLFYSGPVLNADFRNFELEVEAKTTHATNSGVYFHTQYQAKGFPAHGFEVQICNTCPDEPGYAGRKKTGSLYAVRNVYKQLVNDDEWFKINVLVQGKRVQVRLNGTLVVDYIEPAVPVLSDEFRQRVLSHGTFALQGHDKTTGVAFRRRAQGRAARAGRDLRRVDPSRLGKLPGRRLPRPFEGRMDHRTGSRKVAQGRHLLRHRDQWRQGLPGYNR